MRRVVHLLVLACLTASVQAADGEDTGAAEVKKEAGPKKPSTLAPTTKYLDMWAFLHGHDKLPKVLFLSKPPDDDDAKDAEPPSWLTSAAMAFKDGRKKSVSFAFVAPKDVERVSQRFGLEVGELPAVVGCSITAGKFDALKKLSVHSGGGALLKAVKTWVKDVLVAEALGDDSKALPAFPEPTRPRKQASLSLEEFTHETLGAKCYHGNRPLCILAVLPQLAGAGCPAPIEALAKRFRNDQTLTFGCVGGAKQTDFLAGFQLDASALPALLAVKGAGKRPRAARMTSGAFGEAAPMAAFVDTVLGGGVTFSRLSNGLPDLEPPALLDADEPHKEEL